eukprot:2885386-Pyramimonas_sp.AAC.6
MRTDRASFGRVSWGRQSRWPTRADERIELRMEVLNVVRTFLIACCLAEFLDIGSSVPTHMSSVPCRALCRKVSRWMTSLWNKRYCGHASERTVSMCKQHKHKMCALVVHSTVLRSKYVVNIRCERLSELMHIQCTCSCTTTITVPAVRDCKGTHARMCNMP